MIIKNNLHPDGKVLPPDRRRYKPLPCITRQMTEEERLKYGAPNPVERPKVIDLGKLTPEKHRERKEMTEYLETGVMPQEVVDLSKRVKAIREKKGLKQSEFAALAGISQKTVSDLEWLRRLPRPKTLEKIEKCLKDLE